MGDSFQSDSGRRKNNAGTESGEHRAYKGFDRAARSVRGGFRSVRGGRGSVRAGFWSVRGGRGSVRGVRADFAVGAKGAWQLFRNRSVPSRRLTSPALT